MPNAYRPQPFWLFKGAVLGAASGSVVATALLLGDLWGRVEEPGGAYVPSGPYDAVSIGLLAGGFVGAFTGLLVGAVMTFLVGGQLSSDAQRRRALVLGTVLPPLALGAVAFVLTGELLIHSWASLAVFATLGALGGPLARWAADIPLPRPDVVS